MASNEAGTNLAWFLAGAALGAAVAILVAPQSGIETREQLKRRALAGRDRVSQSSRDVVEKGREIFERGKELADEAGDLFEKGKQALRRGEA
jgi:gas vesicle protein